MWCELSFGLNRPIPELGLGWVSPKLIAVIILRPCQVPSLPSPPKKLNKFCGFQNFEHCLLPIYLLLLYQDILHCRILSFCTCEQLIFKSKAFHYLLI